MFQTKVVEKIKTHILWSITPPPSLENRAFYGLMWDIVQQDRPQTVWRMRSSYWITKAASTHYVILIAFPMQQWLHERASMLRYSTLPVLCLLLRRGMRQMPGSQGL